MLCKNPYQFRRLFHCKKPVDIVKVHKNSLRLPTIKIPTYPQFLMLTIFQAYNKQKKQKKKTGLNLETQQKKTPRVGIPGFPPWILPSVTVEALHFVVPIPGDFPDFFVIGKMTGRQGPLELILGERGVYTSISKNNGGYRMIL